MTPETKAQANDRRINHALARVSQTSLAFAVETLEQRRRRGCRPSSNMSYLLALIRFDAYLQGKPFREADAAAISAYLREYQALGRSPSSVKLMAIHTQSIMKDALKVPETRDLPYEVRQALKVARPNGNVRGAVIPDDAFLEAVRRVSELPYQQCSSYFTELIRCLFWCLRDGGFRIGELLSLRVSDVAFDDATKTAKLTMREELVVSHGLKTGARFVILRDAVPALKDWLAVHPGRADPEAPLITALAYYRNEVRGLNVDSVNRVIKEAFALVGAKPVGRRKHFSAHDFRHTAATHDARNGYREPALRQKYGWGPNSPMPAHYVHLSEEDARQRVLATKATGAFQAAPAPAVKACPDCLSEVPAAARKCRYCATDFGAAAAPVLNGGSPPAGAAPAQAS